MDRKEAAAKWAEAKEALEQAVEVSSAAQEKLGEAIESERGAWGALEELAGRGPVQPVEVADVLEEQRELYVTGGPDRPTRKVYGGLG